MVITVTCNPCIDETIRVDGFGWGGANHVESVRRDLGGKGINVSVALHQLGQSTICTGFGFGKDGFLAGELDAKGVPHDFVPCAGGLRVNYKVFEPETQIMSEFNQRGEAITSVNIDALCGKVEYLLKDAGMLVVSGSAPQGVPVTLYRDLIRLGKRKHVKTVLDASGDLLLEGIKAGPDYIKPNRHEIAELTGKEVETPKDAVELCRKLIAQGVGAVLLSLDKDGAYFVTAEGAWHAPRVDVEVKGAQGAGDSMVAGICMAAAQNRPPAELLKLAMSIAHGSLQHEGTGICTPEDLAAMEKCIVVTQI